MLPLKIEKATLVVRARAPGWRIWFAGDINGEKSPLRTADSPPEEFRIDIADGRLLQVDERGGFYLQCGVMPIPGENKSDTQWQIEVLALEVTGLAGTR